MLSTSQAPPTSLKLSLQQAPSIIFSVPIQMGFWPAKIPAWSPAPMFVPRRHFSTLRVGARFLKSLRAWLFKVACFPRTRKRDSNLRQGKHGLSKPPTEVYGTATRSDAFYAASSRDTSANHTTVPFTDNRAGSRAGCILADHMFIDPIAGSKISQRRDESQSGLHSYVSIPTPRDTKSAQR